MDNGTGSVILLRLFSKTDKPVGFDKGQSECKMTPNLYVFL
jgi:hypothetical protein